MDLLLVSVIIFLTLLIWFIMTTDKKIGKDYKKLQIEYNNLKLKYEAQKFEIKQLKDEKEDRNKIWAREFLTDTAFWMRKTFHYAQENKKLKTEKHEET